MNHLMIDTETLGNGPDAAIFAIGAVFFDPFTGKLGKQFEKFIDPVDSERNGGTVNAATAVWWPDNPWRPDPACATQREQSLRQ